MAVADLASTNPKADTTNDSVVIFRNLGTLPGGRTLDVTGFPDDEISAGHVIVQEDSSGEYKPLPVTVAVGDAIPAGHTVKGILVASLLKSNPQAAIMTNGGVNEAYLKYPIPTAAKNSDGLKLIEYINE